MDGDSGQNLVNQAWPLEHQEMSDPERVGRQHRDQVCQQHRLGQQELNECKPLRAIKAVM